MNKIKELLFKTLTKETEKKINNRLKEFIKLKNSDYLSWFSELCFCLLTANTSAERAMKIQFEIGPQGFLEKSESRLAQELKKHGYRFHNIRSKYIVSAREFVDIKSIVQNMSSFEARQFLVKNIKGFGYKESSHFLRNVGYSNLAIIDRHILRFLHQNKLTNTIPKTISPSKYLELEKILALFEIRQDKLDLIIWAYMTGKVLK